MKIFWILLFAIITLGSTEVFAEREEWADPHIPTKEECQTARDKAMQLDGMATSAAKGSTAESFYILGRDNNIHFFAECKTKRMIGSQRQEIDDLKQRIIQLEKVLIRKESSF